MQVEKPQVFKALEQYLGDAKLHQATALKLPAPATPLGGTANNIPIDASGQSISPPQLGAQSIPAKKNPLITVNPKTKRFQSNYLSQ